MAPVKSPGEGRIDNTQIRAIDELQVEVQLQSLCTSEVVDRRWSFALVSMCSFILGAWCPLAAATVRVADAAVELTVRRRVELVLKKCPRSLSVKNC